jgi:protein deglycase
MPKRAVVVLAPGFEEIEAVAPVDVLRRAGVEVAVAGLDGRTVVGSHGIALQADVVMAEVKEAPDAVILPGGMPGAENLARSAAVERLVKAVLQKGGICAAICAAPAFALAKFGILEGKRATCYPGCEGRFPRTATVSEDRVVVDGNVVTSRGPGTALEFSLALAEILAGKPAADKLREGMIALPPEAKLR